MPIDFTPERWNRVRERYGRWWEGELENPLVQVRVADRNPGRPQPAAPILSQANCHEFSIPAADLIDRMDYEYSKITYLGDDFPSLTLTTFGPGIMAALCGADLDNSAGGCWFHPRKQLPIEEIHLAYEPENPWLLRIKEICRAAMDRWEGRVLVQMPDLGGNMDILASFLTTEQLLMALYDKPAEVKRLLWEEHELWFRYYGEIADIIRPGSPGYTDWACIYSETPSYVLQCDFSYMIGPEMFVEFVRPELAASCERLDHSMYHLDGKGQLPHLDHLLSIRELDAIQWVPGAGNPSSGEWPELHRKVAKAGKRMQIHGTWTDLEKTIKAIGDIASPGAIHARLAFRGNAAEAKTCLKDLGIEP